MVWNGRFLDCSGLKDCYLDNIRGSAMLRRMVGHLPTADIFQQLRI
jgi:hypothetical protein